jgi:hypothetical protein
MAQAHSEAEAKRIQQEYQTRLDKISCAVLRFVLMP